MSSASKTYGVNDIERILIEREFQKDGKETKYYLVAWKADDGVGRRPQWIAEEGCPDDVLKYWRDTQIVSSPSHSAKSGDTIVSQNVTQYLKNPS